MKRLILSIIAICLSISVWAQNIDSLYYAFEQCYDNMQYEQAIIVGNELLKELDISSQRSDKYVGVVNVLANCYASCGNTEKAIEMGSLALVILENTVGEEHIDYASTSDNLANYYSDTGEYGKAIELSIHALEIRRKVLGENHPDYALSLCNLASYYSHLGDYARAIELGLQAMEIRKNVLGEEHPDYAFSMCNLADDYFHVGEYDKAIELSTHALEIRRRVLGESHPDYALSLDNLAVYCSDLGEFDKAIELSTQALEVRRKVLGEDHPAYAVSLNNLANTYSNMGNYAKAIEFSSQAVEIRKRILGEEHPDYALSLSNLASYYYYTGNYVNAIEYGTQALTIQKKVLGEEHPLYALSLNNLAVYYSDLGEHDKAFDLCSQAVEIRKKVLGEEHPLYALSLNNLADEYSDLGNNAKAIEIVTQASEIQKKVLGDEHPDYSTTLSNLANLYSIVGNYAEAIELGSHALEIRKKVFGEEHPYYAVSLNNLANYYSYLGDYAKAIELGSKTYNILKNVFGEEHPNSATALDNLAGHYYNLGNPNKAIELESQALDIRKKIFGCGHSSYANSLSNLASYYSANGDYNKALELNSEALNIRKTNFGEGHPHYALSLSNIASDYAHLGNYDKAIELAIQAMETRRVVLGDEHPEYALSLNRLSSYYIKKGDYTKAEIMFQQQLNSLQASLLSNLSSFSSENRKMYWEKYNKQFQLYPNFIDYSEQILGDVYDKSCLFSKGLLLSADTEMRKIILESGDDAALEKYEQLLSLKARLNKLYELPIAERQVNVDSLERIADGLESDLIKMSKAYGDILHNLKLTWHDVQEQLRENDIAIEFLAYPILDSDTIQYIALTIRKGYDSPHMVKLFDEFELKTIETSYYNNPQLSQILWKPLEDELNGVMNIYFSPSGELYNIAIESIPHWSGNKMLSDCYHIYRLSSTRELAMIGSETESSGAVVYGGIQYDTDIAQMGTPSQDTKYFAFRGFNPNSVSSRGNWSYLPGSLDEANEVDSILYSKMITVQKVTGSAATETTFKGLTGQRKHLLHIATHGFYYDDSTAHHSNERERLGFLQMDNGRPRYVEDKAMTRSGLLFAGAQNTFDGVKIPDGVDDGVLTAQEVSQLDLRGLDLLVLSACQTGLGKITGDGVFGLQRGFKKAGAKSILMSLWEVDDSATKDLMANFYTALTQGISKREAFNIAQQYIKEHENNYYQNEERPSWAAFILLDALD